jgi:hypothetical protein
LRIQAQPAPCPDGKVGVNDAVECVVHERWSLGGPRHVGAALQHHPCNLQEEAAKGEEAKGKNVERRETEEER